MYAYKIEAGKDIRSERYTHYVSDSTLAETVRKLLVERGVKYISITAASKVELYDISIELDNKIKHLTHKVSDNKRKLDQAKSVLDAIERLLSNADDN